MSSGEVYEAYAVKPKLIELLRSINGEKLHPEDFFKISGQDLWEIHRNVCGCVWL